MRMAASYWETIILWQKLNARQTKSHLICGDKVLKNVENTMSNSFNMPKTVDVKHL